MTRWPVRGFLASKMRKATAAKARREHYPSPFALIDLFAKYGGNPRRMAGKKRKYLRRCWSAIRRAISAASSGCPR